MKLRTADGDEIQLDQKIVDDLKTRVRGEVLFPGEAAYEDARTVWNAMIDRRPGMIVRCLGSGDVMAGVTFARQHGVAISIKGGGHNIAGLAVCDGGLMLDMSRARGVWVDRQARTAHAQAGCLLGDVDRETQLHGLAATLGFVSNTGVAGLTVGGGFGYLTRRFGWTCDTVRSMDVVTADGRLVRASESENPDLFWGLRGGGGNFGIVTSFEFELNAIGPEILGGRDCVAGGRGAARARSIPRVDDERSARAHRGCGAAQGAARALAGEQRSWTERRPALRVLYGAG